MSLFIEVTQRAAVTSNLRQLLEEANTARQSGTVEGSREPASWLLTGGSRKVALEGVEPRTGSRMVAGTDVMRNPVSLRSSMQCEGRINCLRILRSGDWRF